MNVELLLRREVPRSEKVRWSDPNADADISEKSDFCDGSIERMTIVRYVQISFQTDTESEIMNIVFLWHKSF